MKALATKSFISKKMIEDTEKKLENIKKYQIDSINSWAVKNNRKRWGNGIVINGVLYEGHHPVVLEDLDCELLQDIMENIVKENL